MNDDLIICRCEEITVGDIRDAIADGRTSVSGIKRQTRAGMGACQGRTCGQLIASMLRAQGVAPGIEGSLDTPRSPLVPVLIGQLKEDCDD